MASSPAPRRKRRIWLKLVFSLLAALVLLVFLEGVASILRAWREAGGPIQQEGHSAYDAELGWSLIPSRRLDGFYGPGRHLTTNERGFRATHEFTREVPEGRFRIICLGDSFTLGEEVGDEDTWPAHLEQSCPAIQTVNMGQAGYGVDQSYLWYRRDGVKLDADMLVLGAIPWDFLRMLDDRFATLYPKPVLEVEDRALTVGNVPVPEDWTDAATRRRLRMFSRELAVVQQLRRWIPQETRRPEGWDDLAFAEVAELVLVDLARLCRERDQGFAVALLPTRAPAPVEKEIGAWLKEVTRRLGIPLIDVTEAFAGLKAAYRDSMYRDSHFSAAGNLTVAQVVLRDLRRHFPKVPR